MKPTKEDVLGIVLGVFVIMGMGFFIMALWQILSLFIPHFIVDCTIGTILLASLFFNLLAIINDIL